MKSRLIVKLTLFLISIIFETFVLLDVINRNVNNWSLLFWLLGIFLFYLSFPFSKRRVNVSKEKRFVFKDRVKKIPIVAILIILISLGIRAYFMLDEERYHTDEYLTAHYSYSIGKISELDWFGVYPPKGVWFSQFPLPFFLFQKIFFNIFGLNTLVMRFSTLPYVFLAFLFLFLIAKELFGKKVAYLSIIISSLLSFDVYITSWGLHFISSTAFFLGATYFFVKSYQKGGKINFTLAGVFLALCYMTYYTSYVGLPLILLFFILLFLTKKVKRENLKNYLLALGVFIYAISPLIAYAINVENFFVQRINQVHFLKGEWSEYVNDETVKAFEIFKKQTLTSVKSLYKDGVGGHAGYFFGRLALFEPLSFVAFILGIIYFTFKGTFRKEAKYLFILATVFASFFGGMVFTTHPPPFHRFSLAFPFISLLISETILKTYKSLKRYQRKTAKYYLIVIVSVLLMSNFSHFQKILLNDPKELEYLEIENDIKNLGINYLYISSFHSYGLGKVLFIRSGGKINSYSEGIDTILAKIPRHNGEFLIVLYPDDESKQKVVSSFPAASLIKNYEAHSLYKLD